MNAQGFNEFLIGKVDKDDRLILPDIKPMDGWTIPKPTWWNRRELVRKIAEGLGYQPTVEESEA